MRSTIVTFYSPGTFFSESSSKDVPLRDIAFAVEMAQTINERYGAKPYAFRFSTRITAEPIPDGEGGVLQVVPKFVDESGLYFLGGELLFLDDVIKRKDPKELILLDNMRRECPIVVINCNSYKSTIPFGEQDVIVDPVSKLITKRGDNPRLVEYRYEKKKERNEWFS